MTDADLSARSGTSRTSSAGARPVDRSHLRRSRATTALAPASGHAGVTTTRSKPVASVKRAFPGTTSGSARRPTSTLRCASGSRSAMILDCESVAVGRRDRRGLVSVSDGVVPYWTCSATETLTARDPNAIPVELVRHVMDVDPTVGGTPWPSSTPTPLASSPSPPSGSGVCTNGVHYAPAGAQLAPGPVADGLIGGSGWFRLAAVSMASPPGPEDWFREVWRVG
jgi:hypothetical protein